MFSIQELYLLICNINYYLLISYLHNLTRVNISITQEKQNFHNMIGNGKEIQFYYTFHTNCVFFLIMNIKTILFFVLNGL